MSDDDARTEKVVRWLEANLGGKVVHVEPQARWRPVWFAELERAGETLRLCVRGDRVDARHGFPLEHEMKLQQLLHERGIPVARVHGWCDEPRAYVMDAVPGRADFADASDEERDAVMDHYMEILARIHQLDVEPFAKAGILRAERPEDAGRLGLGVYEDAYRAVKKRPDPFLEFFLGWLRRNPLGGPVRESVIVWDSGQLHHEGGRVRAILDLEIGHIGDPMMDLAGFRMRTSVLGFGDFERLYRRYEEVRGEPVDRAAIQYHHLAFTLSNQLAFHAALADPPQGSDYMTNMQWCAETNIYAVEALAEMKGLALGEVPMPEPRPSPAAAGHAHLVRWLRHFEAPNEHAQHDVRIAFRLARHLQRSDEIGDEVVAADLDDLAPLLGTRPTSWQEGDAALERFVLGDDGRHDEALIRLFHRRTHRYRMLLGPEGSAIARHNPIPGFTR
ncbi:MAG: phosphotransferase family protein [Myxococcota bacterium]|nr:phosphotransferase family protein [Myxococcota bacterium]